jgi:CheY-like chemotaxis protein
MRSLPIGATLKGVSQRTLLVDDNLAFLEAAKSVLEGTQFAIVDAVANSADALEKVVELELDLIVLDVDLGEESGFALAQQISDRLDDGAPKMVLISAHPEVEFADLIAESPAVGFLAKSELSRDRLATLLERAA